MHIALPCRFVQPNTWLFYRLAMDAYRYGKGINLNALNFLHVFYICNYILITFVSTMKNTVLAVLVKLAKFSVGRR